VFWVAFVARQFLSWRRASGERRQQLKWLMSGAAVSVAGLAGIFGFQSGAGPIVLSPGNRLVLAEQRAAGRHQRRDREIPAV
jgi:hypothetical protein